MKLSPEVEGIDKARMMLKTLAANPPTGGVSLGLPMRICRDLYAEIREAKETGVPMLPKTGNNPWGGKGKKKKEAA